MTVSVLALVALAVAAGVLITLRWFSHHSWLSGAFRPRRILGEDALKQLLNCEAQGRPPTLEAIAGLLGIPRDAVAPLLQALEKDGFVIQVGGEPRLTDAGRERAVHLIRAHRLWERHLADETGFGATEWHRRAERREHALSPAEVDALSARLGNPLLDPHGDPIPDRSGSPAATPGQPLAALRAGNVARIVHVEDEPESIYTRLVDEGLYPGMIVHVDEVFPGGIRFRADGAEHTLPAVVAVNLSVTPIPGPPPGDEGCPLSTLEPGRRAVVLGLSPRCRGAERRRLVDLGLLPGAVVTVEFRGLGGDPTAYRIRDAVIALRREQASLIRVVVPGSAQP